MSRVGRSYSWRKDPVGFLSKVPASHRYTDPAKEHARKKSVIQCSDSSTAARMKSGSDLPCS